MKKASIGHIEMIISFIVFVGFIIFLFYLFSPLQKSEIQPGVLEFAASTLLNAASINVDQGSLLVKTPPLASCFYVPLLERGKVIATLAADDSSRKAAYSEGSSFFYGAYTSGDTLYHLSFSDQFEENSLDTSGCLSLDLDTYIFGLFVKKLYVFQGSLDQLKAQYDGDYPGLKTLLGLPSDFGFIVRTADGVIRMQEVSRKATKVNVLAKDIPIEVIDKHGKVEHLIMNVQVW